jgi:hypothetical protein
MTLKCSVVLTVETRGRTAWAEGFQREILQVKVRAEDKERGREAVMQYKRSR